MTLELFNHTHSKDGNNAFLQNNDVNQLHQCYNPPKNSKNFIIMITNSIDIPIKLFHSTYIILFPTFTFSYPAFSYIQYINQQMHSIKYTNTQIIQYNSLGVSTPTCFSTGVPSSGSLLKQKTQVQHDGRACRITAPLSTL